MSNDLHQTRNTPADPPTAVPPPSPAGTPQMSPTSPVPHTRTGAAWFGICVAALLFVVLIVFMLQNTRSVEVSFLGMHGNLPLALALLVAAVGAAILTMVVGAALRGTEGRGHATIAAHRPSPARASCPGTAPAT
jgi:uncharacterized integral membrane protein